MTYTPTNLTRSDLQTVVDQLTHERTRRLDVVVPAGQLTPVNANLTVSLPEPALTDYGVVSYLDVAPSDLMIGQMAERLEVPVKYLRRLFKQARNYEAGSHTTAAGTLENVLGHGLDEHHRSSYLLRTFVDDNGTAFGRAFLSNAYDPTMDALDYLITMLDALKEASPNAVVQNIDLTEKNMRIRVYDPSIEALAPELLAGYRSPFRDGYGGETARNPATVFAGFEAGTSDVGHGSRYLVPRLIVQICDNGLKMTKDLSAERHLGGRLGEGIVRWSVETQQRNLDLVRGQVTDMVTTFMDRDYVLAKINELNELAGVEVTEPQVTIIEVGKKLSFTETEVDGILGHFIKGGQTTAGGVMQAITSFAQTVESGDRQSELEDVAVEAMALVR